MKVHCEMEEPAENVNLEYFETTINDLELIFPRKEEALMLFEQLMSLRMKGLLCNLPYYLQKNLSNYFLVTKLTLNNTLPNKNH